MGNKPPAEPFSFYSGKMDSMRKRAIYARDNQTTHVSEALFSLSPSPQPFSLSHSFFFHGGEKKRIGLAASCSLPWARTPPGVLRDASAPTPAALNYVRQHLVDGKASQRDHNRTQPITSPSFSLLAQIKRGQSAYEALYTTSPMTQRPEAMRQCVGFVHLRGVCA